jgi:hypothetical protein
MGLKPEWIGCVLSSVAWVSPGILKFSARNSCHEVRNVLYWICVGGNRSALTNQRSRRERQAEREQEASVEERDYDVRLPPTEPGRRSAFWRPEGRAACSTLNRPADRGVLAWRAKHRAICHRQIAPHLNNCRDDRTKRVRSAKNEKGQGAPERVRNQNEEFDPGSG